METNIYNAAGGNPTAINFGDGYIPSDYARINKELQDKHPEIEQIGFLTYKDGIPRLEMAGGEFCGNATRSFAALLAEQTPEERSFDFFVSGFPNAIRAEVGKLAEGKYFVKALLRGFEYKIERKIYLGQFVSIVNLGGITHVLLDESKFSFNEETCKSDMKRIKEVLGVDNDAVGVIWMSKSKGKASIKPVVWVKAVDTCYYETSCGSGSIAVGLIGVKNKPVDIIQPSGGIISVEFKDDDFFLSSEIEKINL